MRVTEQAKYNSIYFLLLSFGIRWAFNILFMLYKGFTPMQYAILHLVFSVVSVVLAYMAVQLFRKSAPSGSNMGCLYVILLLANFAMAVGSVFGALIHIFGVNGGELESIWLM